MEIIKELARHIGNEMLNRVKCISIHCTIVHYVTEDMSEDGPVENETIEASLPINWDQSDYSEFRNKLSFPMDQDSADYIVTGVIWYEDGTWSIYEHEDMYCGWTHFSCPRIPKNLR